MWEFSSRGYWEKCPRGAVASHKTLMRWLRELLESGYCWLLCTAGAGPWGSCRSLRLSTPLLSKSLRLKKWTYQNHGENPFLLQCLSIALYCQCPALCILLWRSSKKAQIHFYRAGKRGELELRGNKLIISTIFLISIQIIITFCCLNSRIKWWLSVLTGQNQKEQQQKTVRKISSFNKSPDKAYSVKW